MRIGLYVIGDEILSGKRQDRHLENVSGLLRERGLQLSWVKFLGDDLDILVAEFQQSFKSDDLVFSCGGIGATPDDMTRQAVAKALGLELLIHPEGLKILESRAKYFDGGLTEQRKRMVEFPVGASLIPNPVNKVPGFSIGQHFFVPGFPKMAQPMIQWVLEENYANLNNKDYREWSVTLYEVPESDIADLMDENNNEIREIRTVDMVDHEDNLALTEHFLDCLANKSTPQMSVELAAKHLDILFKILEK